MTRRRAWFVELDGKQVKLGDADKKTKVPPDEVLLEYHRLMANGGLLTDREREQATVPVVAEAFIASKAEKRPKTIKACMFYMQPFAEKFNGRRISSVKTAEVLDFVKKTKTWGSGTKHNAIIYIKGLFKWSYAKGFIDRDTMIDLANPYPAPTRERGITLEEFDILINGTIDNQFKAVLRFLRDVGCRPGDLCKLSARHLHSELPMATLQPDEHKTGGRTGKVKDLYLTASIDSELRELARTYPDSPLLRNTEGNPWTTDTIEKRFTSLRERLGLPKHVIPYTSRHALITRLVDLGTPLATIAKIVGHKSTETIMSSYYKPEQKGLMKIINDAAVHRPQPQVEPLEEKVKRLEAENAALKAELVSLKAASASGI